MASLILKQLAGVFGRRLSHIFLRLRLIGLVVALASLFVISSITHFTTSVIIQQSVITSASDNVMIDNSTTPSSSTVDITTPSTTTSPVVAPEITEIGFRLINYFDAPMNFDNTPERVSSQSVPTLPVNRYGHFNATLRNKEMVILIPTIYRPKQSYLSQTIRSFLEVLTRAELQRIVILVSINDIAPNSENVVYQTANILIKDFPDEIFSGLIEIIGAPAAFYMNFTNIPDVQDKAIVDTPARLQWRSKQVIDYAFMFSYAFTQQMGKYVLLLEDDVAVTEKSVVSTMLSFPDAVNRVNPPPALTLWYEFCPWGAIGKMFEAKNLPIFVNIMTTVFYVEPVDWQLGHIAELFACRYFHSKKQCDEARKRFFKVFPRKLFKHVAKVSTAPEQPTRKIPKASRR